MENSHIEWTDNTFNIVEGCKKVSPGCKNCYAETRDKIWHRGAHWGPNSTRKQMSESYWRKPALWNVQAYNENRKIKVFCSSLCDVFEDHPDLIEPRERLFKIIESTNNLIWQLLTKRPENILKLVPPHWVEKFPDNVWMGITVENQEYADIRIPFLLKVPARVRFLSCEPLLDKISLEKWFDQCPKSERVDGNGHSWLFDGDDPYVKCAYCKEYRDARYGYTIGASYTIKSPINWVICGGESGRNARPMHMLWARALRDQCKAAGVAFFFKQWGEWRPYATNPVSEGIPLNVFSYQKKIYKDSEFFTMPGDMSAANAFKDFIWFKTGKKAAGALLDGKEYKEFPHVKHI